MKQHYILKKLLIIFKKHKSSPFIFTLFFTLFWGLDGIGQTDDCNNNSGGQLTVGTSCNVQTWNSNNNTDYWNSATGCGANDSDDAWGWFIATSSSTTITYNSTEDAVLHLFTGGCAKDMSALACSDSTWTGNETITYTTTPGVRYRIRIQRYDSNDTMNGTLCVYSPTSPCTTPTAQPTALNLLSTTTSITGNFTNATPVANSYLVIRSLNNVPPTPPTNGVTYTVGNTYQAGYTVVDNDSNTSFTTNGLAADTRYYFFVYSFNEFCTGGPLYLGTNPLTGNILTNNVNYCVPTTATPAPLYFNRIDFVGTLNDVTNTSTFSTNGYQNFTTLTNRTKQAQGEGVNIILNINNTNNGSLGGMAKVWIDWNKNGIFEEDSVERIYNPDAILAANFTFGFVVPATAAPGLYRIRFRVYNNSNSSPCTNTNYGEVEDYLFEVIPSCNATIVSVTEGTSCGSGTVVLSATGSTGTTSYRWYTSETGGSSIVGATNATFTTPSLTTTSTYYVTAFNGSCESLVRTPVVATIAVTPTIRITPENPEICGENTVISVTASGDKELVTLLTEDFESGNLSTFENINTDTNDATTDNKTAWQIKSSTHLPSGGIAWFPAISSGLSGNKFAIAISDISPKANTTIENHLTLRNSLNTTNFLNLTLKLRMYYSRELANNDVRIPEFVNVQISTDDGFSWTNIDNILSDKGIGTRFETLTYNLNGYIDNANVKIRITHSAYSSSGEWLVGGVAIDDVKIFGEKNLATPFSYNTNSVDAYVDSACTIPHTSGSSSPIIYIKPTESQLESASLTIPVSTTLSNGCSISGTITVTNKSKIWKGTTDTDWNKASNWIPTGIPDLNTCVIIPTSVISTLQNAPAAYAKNVVVKNGGTLQIQPQQSLTVKETVTVASGGNFEIENGGSLVQVDNVTNTGVIRMKRNTNIKTFDYVYWSSPVANFAASAVSPGTSAGLIYKWLPTTTTGYASYFGNWTGGNENMAIGKGYIIRAPNSWTPTPSIYTATFTGVPNNGNISIPISRSTYVGSPYAGPTATPVTKNDDNWNLIGNPYPSAIDAVAFLNTNATIIENFVDLWTHGDAPAAIASPFYQNFTLNYNPNNYNRYNALGGTQHSFDGKIAAGQGFFVLMNDAGATTENIQFNNSMRSNLHRNDQFYRTTSATSTERHRIWLKMISPSLNSVDILLGYASNATNQIDASFDAPNKGIKVNYELYSLCENKGFLIQGRALPFDVSDEIPLGIKISENGIHTISITKVDGLFNDTTQKIFLEDRTLGVVHDLTLTPYSFTENVGINENRFVLRFDNGTLGNADFTFDTIKVFTNESINVAASNETIKSVKVYDLLGRVLGSFQNINETNFVTNRVSKTQNPLLIEVTLENGNSKTFKVIY